MFGFLKRLFSRSPSRDRTADPDDIVEEQWQADFSREDIPGRQSLVRFFITSENLYRAYLYKNALRLGVKKTNCIAWTEDMQFRYQDLDMRGRIRLESGSGYAAAGFIFRMVDELTYYMALVSNRGYFRLDLVRNSTPLALAGWTEAPGLPVLEEERDTPVEFDLEVITYGSRILLLINGQWAGAWNDASLPEGRIGFAAASYETRKGPARSAGQTEFDAPDGSQRFAAEASLLSFSLDSRITEVGNRYDTLEDTALPENRVRLAETFTALGRTNAALAQLRKAWEGRETAAAALAAEVATAEDGVVLAAIQIETPETYIRKPRELFLAAKLALALEQWDEAEEYLEALAAPAGPERAGAGEELLKQARNMKAAFLYSRGRYGDLIQWTANTAAAEDPNGEIQEAVRLFADPAALYNLLGHAYFNSWEYQKAAEAYDRAGKLDEKNGMTAKNAAASYELLNQNEAALERYLKAGRAFLAGNSYEELGLLIPKFRLLGETNWEARALIGKWSFGVEDWKTAREELDRAEELRKETEVPEQGAKLPAPDPALYFLQGLLLSRSGRRREALPLFEKAVSFAPDYPLFRFRLAENRFMLDQNPDDPRFLSDLEAALTVNREEEEETYGWVHNFAAHVALTRGDLDQAKSRMDKASAILGEIPAVRVNRAVALYLTGSPDEALNILESKQEEDPEGLMANCAGNLLVRARRFEEADGYYRRAVIAAPDNVQYRCNRASCLIELGRYGEADAVLTSGGGISPEANPDMLELIAFVAVKKGEYQRAEAAALAALTIDPDHVPSLISLGWTKAFGGHWDELEKTLDHLDQLELSGDAAKGRDDLERWMEEALYRTVSCAICGREWRVERNGKSVPAIKLYAMPPDDMPAGACPGCGKIYCVGCRRDDLDESGRFTCPDCGKSLKLSDDGLKALLYDWAETNLKKRKRKKKNPPAEDNAPSAPPPEPADGIALPKPVNGIAPKEPADDAVPQEPPDGAAPREPADGVAAQKPPDAANGIAPEGATPSET
ncbi:MAG: tetratricopeptide repeat protein [Spirochaetaceae bacterium]|jgi:tetratricopeptide (TPR) repeat protein|nr:tetratricopeptide repeat protein [Spirochaetaceae bacterium]